MNSIALEERRNVINEKLAKKERKKKKKKKEKKEKSSKDTAGSESNSTGPSNCCADMAENESTQIFINNIYLLISQYDSVIFRFVSHILLLESKLHSVEHSIDKNCDIYVGFTCSDFLSLSLTVVQVFLLLCKIKM